MFVHRKMCRSFDIQLEWQWPNVVCKNLNLNWKFSFVKVNMAHMEIERIKINALYYEAEG